MARDRIMIQKNLDNEPTMEVVFEKLVRIEQIVMGLNLNSKEVLNFHEACQFLGLSSSHLYKCTSQGKISHFKPSKKIYFNRQDLIEWMQQNRVCSNSELVTIADRKIEKLQR